MLRRLLVQLAGASQPVMACVAWGCLMLRGAAALGAVNPTTETLNSPSPEFVVNSWRIQQGLPSDRVRAVLQTRDGYLWVATFNGAARFDGVRFRVFNDANTPALTNSLVSCLFEDSGGRLWLGSDTGEITWRDTGGFHALTVTNYWPNSPIDRVVEGADGALWIVSREGFLMCVRNLKAETVLGDPAGPLYSDSVRDRDGQIWAVQYGGSLVRLSGDKAIPADDVPASRGDYRTIAPARQGGLWVRDGTRLRRWYRGDWVEDRREHSWQARQAVALYEAADGAVWVGTREDGAFIVAADGSEHHINRASGLASDLVSNICDDREGNVWLASDAGGLCMLRPRAIFMVSPPDQSQSRPVSSVSPSQEGGLWVGTAGAGVYKLLRGELRALSASNSPIAKDIRTVLEDRTGRLWVGTEVRERLTSGLLVLTEGRLEVGTQAAGLLLGAEEGLRPVTRADTHIEMPLMYYAIHQSQDGALWLGSNRGLVCQKQDQWRRLGMDLYRPEVRCITETPDGAIWIGMRGGGVARYRDGVFRQFLRAQGLPYDYAWSILGDTDGSVWIGTPGAGLIRWRDEQFVSFTSRQGLPSDFICSLLADQQGYLWLGSYAGILKVAKADLNRCANHEAPSVNCLVLDGSDGLTSLEMAGGNQPTACATADGRLCFATSGGLALVDPARIRTNALPPPVLLEEVVVDGKALSQEHSTSSLSSPASFSSLRAGEEVIRGGSPAAFRVPPGGGQVELRYTALSFCAPQRVRFRYRMEKVDSDWVEAGLRRSANYAHLAPGNYRFQVVACNNDGVWNPNSAELLLAVTPYYWQTWWFAPCCWLAGICVVGAATVATLRRRQHARIEALERARLVERERGRIARDLHDDLGSGLTDIGTTSSLGQHPSASLEEAREYFGEIGQRSNEMVAALDEIVWAVNPKNDDLVALATYFSQFTEHFVRRTPIRCRFEIPDALPRLPLNAEQRHSLFLAFKEALQNAVKHASASSLRVSIIADRSTLKITLEDDGCGFEQGAQKAGADGLRNMRERLEQLGGRCEIATGPGKGTRVIFQVPT